jgi:cytochrome c peroxidase
VFVKRIILVGVLLCSAALAVSITRGQQGAPPQWPEIPTFEAMKIPADNPMTPEKVELGRQLYYDARLSGDGSKACYSCHVKEKGLTDGLAKAQAPYGQVVPRSAPTMWNIGYHSEWYWDGRARTLEAQARAAWNGVNMGATGRDGRPSMDGICARLNAIEGYRLQFEKVFGTGCTPDQVARALAAFMRVIVTTPESSAWVRFKAGDKKALSAAAQRGLSIFEGKARCANCHAGVLLTDLQYHNVGIGMEEKEPDLGRHRVTKEERDKGAFKTPTLLDIAKSAPYFHNGQIQTLEEAVDLMLAGGVDNPWLDSANLRPPVKLSKRERADLLTFLRSLQAEYRIEAPRLP